MAAITKGATHRPSTSSTMGLLPEGWRGPSKPGVSENGLRSSSSTPGWAAAAAMVALRLAAVPPEKGQIGRDTSELQSQSNLVCRLLLEKKNLHHAGQGALAE